MNDAFTVACPVCGSPIDAPCKRLRLQSIHAERQTLANKQPKEKSND